MKYGFLCLLYLTALDVTLANPRSLTHLNPRGPLLLDGIQYHGPDRWIVYIESTALTPQNRTHRGWTLCAVEDDHVILKGYGEKWTVWVHPKLGQ